MNHSLAPFLKRFFSHYLPVQKGLSVNTIKAYRDAAKLLLCYAADNLGTSVDELAVESITQSLLLDFLDHLEQTRGSSKRTRNVRLAAIRSLFAFIAREEPVLVGQCQAIRSIPLKRTEHKTIDYLEENEMQVLLDTVDINSRTGIRDRALLMVLYNTGARVSEIVNLELADLRLTNSTQVRLHGKGNKERTCPIWPETVQAIEDYLKKRAPNDHCIQQLFLNANGDPITRFGMRHVTRKYGDLAKAKQPSLSTKPVNPHRIRHTTAMHLLRAGNDINMVSYWLGHADLNTTHIYLEIDMEMKRNMLKKADAPRIKKIPPWRIPNILQWLNELTKQTDLCAAKFGGKNHTGGKRRVMNNQLNIIKNYT